MNIELIRLSGEEARGHVNELADLRLKVFWDFPYLYEGTAAYEKKYLETYFQAQHSFILLIKDQDKIVGATTGIWAREEEENFRQPFEQHNLDPAKVFYFGESVLLPEYRGRGLGKVFLKKESALLDPWVLFTILHFVRLSVKRITLYDQRTIAP